MGKEDYVLYLKGLNDGIRAFAWWKDGLQYVGTCGTTLSRAIEMVDTGGLYDQRQSPRRREGESDD